jgi:hypothetical protein
VGEKEEKEEEEEKEATSTKVTEMQQHLIAENSDMKLKLRRLEQMVRGIAVAPARMAGPGRTNAVLGDPNISGDNRVATLCAAPRTLGILWDEYLNGTGGGKPECEFTREERGRVKYKYSRRLPFWTCMKRLIERGNTAQTAIRKIQGVYGDNNTVSDVLLKLRQDERNGGHASLRI